MEEGSMEGDLKLSRKPHTSNFGVDDKDVHETL